MRPPTLDNHDRGPKRRHLLAQRARLTVVDEGEDYLVLDKPGDLICHPSVGDEYTSLIGRIRLYYEDQPGINPHLVNRLDRETSGLVLVSKREDTHKFYCEAFQKARKTYWAVVDGWPEADQGVIDSHLGPDQHSLIRLKQAVVSEGKEARTAWRVIQRFERDSKPYTLLEVQPRTGRTHQIRVHLAHVGHPVVGDKIYGADETYFLESIQHGWTQRLEQSLGFRRHLLSALELTLLSYHWKTQIPQDILDFARL